MRWKVITICLAFALLGLVILVLNELFVTPVGHVTIGSDYGGGAEGDAVGPSYVLLAFSTGLHHLGAFFLAGGIVAVIWEYSIRKEFRRESERLIKDAIDQSAGVMKVCSTFYTNTCVDWERYFSESKTVRVFFARGEKWSNIVANSLNSFCEKKSNTLLVAMPDPRNPFLMGRVALRNGDKATTSPRRLSRQREKMSTAILKWRGYVDEANKGSNKCSSKLYFVNQAPEYTLFLFDSIAILSLYTYSESENQWPIIVCRNGGDLYRQLEAEFEEILKCAIESTPSMRGEFNHNQRQQFRDWALEK